MQCCSENLSRHGRVVLSEASNKSSFIFSVNEEFLKKNPNSPKDKTFPKITEAELNLLNSLLDEKKYCTVNSRKPLFVINSRQEQIYDITFSHLIEQNYRARPVYPRTYFGQCK
jgi:hypothetical protein